MTTTLDSRHPGRHMRLVRDAACAPVRPWPSRASARRQRRRARRVHGQPLELATASAARASLATTGSDGGPRFASLAVWVFAVAAHAALAFAVWRTRPTPAVGRSSTRITVQVHDARPPAAPSVAAPILAAPSHPHAPRLVRIPAARAPRAARPPQLPAAPVKVVGLSLESTSEAGAGPAFAAGDTLAGTTAGTAVSPRSALASTAPPPGPNRIAKDIPRPGSVLTPPRRLHEVKPRYPDAERAAGVEADVLLIVSLDAAGRILSITVGRSSGDDAFDESARLAARQERFSPALRDGAPVPTTFTFTTHFRLDTP